MSSEFTTTINAVIRIDAEPVGVTIGMGTSAAICLSGRVVAALSSVYREHAQGVLFSRMVPNRGEN